VLVNVVGGAPGRTDNSSVGGGPPQDGWADLLPELGRHKSDRTISKVRWGAFHDIGLYEHLTGRGVTQVVIVGIATSVGVESTARTSRGPR
jgi:nicotinamidase-related amidase